MYQFRLGRISALAEHPFFDERRELRQQAQSDGSFEADTNDYAGNEIWSSISNR
jgi:hypothetical protein